MKRSVRCGLLVFSWLMTLGARPGPPPRTAVTEIPPSLVLQRYEEALASLKTPPNLIFEYSVEQSGLRNIEQVHRVYRGGGRERDETLRVNGTPLKPPAVRVFEAPDRYDVNRLAPKPGDYVFTFASRAIVEGRAVYTFRSDIQKLAAFAVTRVDIDIEHFLPRTLYFHSVNGATKGTGRVNYAPQSKYWLPREASVEARTASGKNARERITWSKFGFPERLPPSTFSPPRPQETPTP
jgi:hypothetical protein